MAHRPATQLAGASVSRRAATPGRQVSRRWFLGWCSGVALAPALVGCNQSGGAARSTNPGVGGGQPVPGATSGAAVLRSLGSRHINWNAVSGSMSGIWMADETGAWRECGIEPELSNITSSSKVLPVLIANDIDGSVLDVLVGVRGIASGTAVGFLARMTDKQIFSVFVRPEIQDPAELAGKQWASRRSVRRPTSPPTWRSSSGACRATISRSFSSARRPTSSLRCSPARSLPVRRCRRTRSRRSQRA